MFRQVLLNPARDRWLAAPHLHRVEVVAAPAVSGSRGPQMRLGDLYVAHTRLVRAAAIAEDSEVDYIALEHITPHTGMLIGDLSKRLHSINGVFREVVHGQVLYNRLRPAQNKVALVERAEGARRCFSGIELYVLTPRTDLILPAVLRDLLAGPYVLSQVVHQVGGMALPRVSLDDLSEIRVTVPDLQAQRDYLAARSASLQRRAALVKQLAELDAASRERANALLNAPNIPSLAHGREDVPS